MRPAGKDGQVRFRLYITGLAKPTSMVFRPASGATDPVDTALSMPDSRSPTLTWEMQEPSSVSMMSMNPSQEEFDTQIPMEMTTVQ
jgi:hypothetical protein